MKKFYYRCSFNVCLWAFLSLIGFMLLSSSAFALQSGGFYYDYYSNSTAVAITGYVGCPNAGAVVIPSAITAPIGSLPVVVIKGGAFAYCTGLTSVTIPGSVTNIEQYAFRGCSGLTSVTFGNGVTIIGEQAFYDCSSLTGVTFPNSVESIGPNAFGLCPGLASVTFPDSVISLGQYAFLGCTGLTSVTFPNSKNFTSIGACAFQSCSGLTSVTIPNSVASIGNAAFKSCTGLTSVTIPDSVTSIGGQAFMGCSGLTSAYFLGNAPSLGYEVFSGCASNFSVCYTAGSTGFYPVSACSTASTTAPPTNIELSILEASPSDKQVILKWKTETEIDNAGFNVWRAEGFQKMNESLIPTEGTSVMGADYDFFDKWVMNGKLYYYLVEDIDTNGISTFHGPVKATPRRIYGAGK